MPKWTWLLFVLVLVGCGETSSLDEAAMKLIEGRDAIAQGNRELAIEALTVSIDSRPNTWAYYERGRLHAEVGNDEQANADIDAGLVLDPEHSELLWLQKQMKRPVRARFQSEAPSATK